MVWFICLVGRCNLSEMQKFWYKRLLLKDSEYLEELERKASSDGVDAAGTGSWRKLQALMMQLRKCCLHPYLFEEADLNPGYSDESLVEACGKLQILDLLLAKLHEKGHRVVLFSQYTQMLDILEDFLSLREYQYCRLDGSCSRVQRTVEMNSFNSDGSPLFCFLMTTRSGGNQTLFSYQINTALWFLFCASLLRSVVTIGWLAGLGINLQTADTVILYDSDWNPQPDLQAMARVHRIGQTKVVHVYRLVTRGTIEERIVERAENKLYLDQMVNSKELGDMAADQETFQETLDALSFGAHAVAGLDTEEPPTSEELDAIIDRTRTTNQSMGRLVGGTERNAKDFEVTNPSQSIRQLNGTLYDKNDKKKTYADTSEIADEWNQTRKRVARTTTIHVKGVGDVDVLTSEMNQESQPPQAKVEPSNPRKQVLLVWCVCVNSGCWGVLQKAGRDYGHFKLCLSCWEGGDDMVTTHCTCFSHY